MANYINLTIGGLNEGYGSAAGASAGYMVDGSQPYNFIINGNNSFNFTIYRNETLGCNVDPAADIYCGGELVGHLPISDNSCAIEGNVDVYGMGIRIGLYLQWTSTLLTFFYHPSTFSELLVANCTFSIAVSIAYLVIFRTLYRQEVFIVAMLLSMTLLMIPLEILDFVLYYRDPKRLTGSLKQKLVSGAATTAEAPSAGERPAEGEVPAAASSSAHPAPSPSSKAAPAPAMPAIVIVLRGVHRNVKKNIHHIGGIAWFIATAFLLIIVAFQYWSGTKMGQPNPEGCHPKLLWTFYTQPPYENVMKAMYLLLAILAGLAMIVYLLVQASDAASAHKTVQASTGKSWITRMRASMNEYRKQHHTYLYKASIRARVMAAMFFGIVMGFSVAYMETVIYQNSVAGVRSLSGAGQIIPFIVGVTSFMFTIYVVLSEEAVEAKPRAKVGVEKRREGELNT